MTQLLLDHHLLGLAIGLATFLVIGLFHPIVIKCEYWFGTRCWWWFLLSGAATGTLSVLITDALLSSVLGVTAFSCFWSILEIFEQSKRVERGWFPANPRRQRGQSAESSNPADRQII